jgi:hypothetical protein
VPPPSSRKTPQVGVRRLRSALGDGCRITHDAAGYAVVVEPDELAVLRSWIWPRPAGFLAERMPGAGLDGYR